MFTIFQKEKSYQKLFFAGIINGIGDRFSQVALMTLILQMTGSGLSVGITLALRMLPYLIFGPVSSSIATKLSRKKLLIYTDLFRACIALSFLGINSPEDLWIIYVGSFLLASGEALYAPTRSSSIPSIVKQSSIKVVNSWEQVLLGFVLIFGALTGGFVSLLFGTKASFSVNIVSFVITAGIIHTIPTLEAVTKTENAGDSEKIIPRSLFSLVLSSPLLILLVSNDMVVPLANGIENVLISVYAVETFHAADLGVGILYSVLGTGFILSPIITKKINGNYLLIAFACLIAEGLILFVVSQSTSFLFVVFLFGILTIFGGVSNALLDTVVMKSIPIKYQGIYFGFSATIANTGFGLSMFFTGVLLEYVHPRMMGCINGALYILFGLFYFIWSIKFYVKRKKKFTYLGQQGPK
ncbi:MFS transporter [Niallia sp. 03133]|uniref:MFS transporter n=1 Tax=Niallia sp. 03133 TaxID=3458060 RepID=UPI0040443552